MGEHPIIPDYGGACICNLVPALIEAGKEADWLPGEVRKARTTVLLVLDGLGWEQLTDRRHLARNITEMRCDRITTVAPSTTATAMTSLTTGLPPGEHGVVGYRIHVRDEVLNVLRWSTLRGDARDLIPPAMLQPRSAFGGTVPPVVTRAEFSETGFTGAHLSRVRFHGYRVPSTLVTEVARLVRSGERFVYGYYDGVDKVAHEYGLGAEFDAELEFVDFMVSTLLERLPSGTAVVITSDHGQVHVGDRLLTPAPAVLELTRFQSGEARFRWLHARDGAEKDLLEAARENHEDVAWVKSRDELIEEGWFGPRVTPAAASAMGDVALVAREPIAFVEPTDTGPYELVGRHGSLTAAEMYVPLLVGVV
ncbi:MAG: phosphodiesterase [Acidimicrobiales bacterium]|nr:MAG: phosphodiesterase [Acidimicrobiales bacterium]